MAKYKGLDDFESKFKEAEWNAGLVSSMRLHFWLQQSNNCSYEEDHMNRKKALDIFYREIKPKLKKIEKEEVEPIKKEIEIEINRIEMPLKSRKRVMTDIPRKLDNYEDKIRLFADNHGLLNPNKETIFDSLGKSGF